MKKIIKFLFIGAINTVFFYLSYVLFIFLGLHYSLAVFIAAVIAMFFSFKTFGKFVFNSKDNRLLFRFIFVTIVNYALNILIIYIFKELGYNYYISGLFATFVVAINSFILNNYFVFRTIAISKEKEYV